MPAHRDDELVRIVSDLIVGYQKTFGENVDMGVVGSAVDALLLKHKTSYIQNRIQHLSPERTIRFKSVLEVYGRTNASSNTATESIGQPSESGQRYSETTTGLHRQNGGLQGIHSEPTPINQNRSQETIQKPGRKRRETTQTSRHEMVDGDAQGIGDPGKIT